MLYLYIPNVFIDGQTTSKAYIAKNLGGSNNQALVNSWLTIAEFTPDVDPTEA